MAPAELIVRDSEDTQNPGETYFLKESLKTGGQAQIASESGFVMGLMTINTAQQSHFLIEPPLNLAFILERLNSTDGSEVLALDLKTHAIRELSRPPGERESSPPPPIEVDPASPMAGEGAFLAITRVRFVPFGSGHKTANSSYLESATTISFISSGKMLMERLFSMGHRSIAREKSRRRSGFHAPHSDPVAPPGTCGRLRAQRPRRLAKLHDGGTNFAGRSRCCCTSDKPDPRGRRGMDV